MGNRHLAGYFDLGQETQVDKDQMVAAAQSKMRITCVPSSFMCWLPVLTEPSFAGFVSRQEVSDILESSGRYNLDAGI